MNRECYSDFYTVTDAIAHSSLLMYHLFDSNSSLECFMQLANNHEMVLRGNHRALFDGLVKKGEFITPIYDGASLVNVPATLFSILGCDPSSLLPPLTSDLWVGLGEGVKRVVLILLDAVGYLRLREMVDAGSLPFLQKAIAAGRFAPLTSVFPSTTTAALASLHTGKAPAQHGMLAYQLYLKRFAMLVDMIQMRPLYGEGDLTEWGLDPESFVSARGIGSLLSEQSVLTAHFIYGGFVNTPLSRIFYRDYDVLCPGISSADMFVKMRHFLEQHPSEKMLMSAYWGSVDTISHRRGPRHPSWEAEVEGLVWSLEQHFLRPLPARLKEDTVLVLLADHGQTRVDYKQGLFINEHPVLERGVLMPPAGESRAAFLYSRAGKLAELQSYLEQKHEDFVAVLSEDALVDGLFGPPPWHEQAWERIGDLLVLAKGQTVIEQDWSDERSRILGRHGGLTPEEMLIPFLAVRLEAL